MLKFEWTVVIIISIQYCLLTKNLELSAIRLNITIPCDLKFDMINLDKD